MPFLALGRLVACAGMVHAWVTALKKVVRTTRQASRSLWQFLHGHLTNPVFTAAQHALSYLGKACMCSLVDAWA